MTTTEQFNRQLHDDEVILESIRGTHNALNVKRAFGDIEYVDGVTVLPVARVAGGAGGGGGEGTDPEKDSSGSGFGSGFGVQATPVGVYQVQDGTLVWHPAIDVTRLARSGIVLAGIVAVCATIIGWRRW